MSESNTGTTDPGSEPQGTSVSTGPNNEKEAQPDVADADQKGPGTQAGAGQAGG